MKITTSTCSTTDTLAAGNGVTRDAFLGGRVTVLQPRRGYRAAVDPVLLAAAVDAHAGDSVLELGCGVGVALLCLLSRVPDLTAAGLEIQPELARLARENAALNGFRIDVTEGDVAAAPAPLRQTRFDHVIANPPYNRPGTGFLPADKSRRLADTETVPLTCWIEFASRRLRPGGTMAMILPPARFPDFFAGLPSGVGGVQAKPVRPRAGGDANRVLLLARKGSRAAFRLAADFILHPSEGSDFTAAAGSVLREGRALAF